MSENSKKGHPGNKHNQKLSTKELRMEAYKQYINHMAAGHSKRTWYFEHPELMLTWQSMETYIKEFASEFNPKQQEIALAKGERIWEDVVADSATGKNRKANTASLQMIMRNKFGWDKQENDKPKEGTNEANLLLLDENLQLKGKLAELEKKLADAIQSKAATKLP